MSRLASRTIAPYGTWKSPITPQLLTSKAISFGEIATLTGSSSPSSIVFTENRPSEKGRTALVSLEWPLEKSGPGEDLTRGNHNARSGVHEYGGGAIATSNADGSIIFTDYNQEQWGVYRVKRTAALWDEPELIAPSEGPNLRYADFQPHPLYPHLILAIQEDHTIDEPSKVVNTLVLIDAYSKQVTILHSGYDFYSSPNWSVTGEFVAWISWMHPSMPFWATEGWVARFDVGTSSGGAALVDARPFAGTSGKEELVAHPVWMPDSNILVFTSDKTEFSLPYKVNVEKSGAGIRLGAIESILSHPIESDFIAPPWTLNNSTFVALTFDLLACVLIQGSSQSLALLSLRSGRLTRVQSPFDNFGQLRRLSEDEIVLIASSSKEPAAIYVVKITQALVNGKLSKADFVLLKQSSDLISSGQISVDYLSVAEDIEFPTTLPDGTPTTAHAILFPPTNPHYSASAGSSPPCIFKIHGGPTSSASKGLSLQTNYWTSKGYSVCFVDYGGSTGHGRTYMLRLMNNWGLVDVLDCVAGARFLGSQTAQVQYKNTREIQKMTKVAQDQWKALEETYHSNGSVRVTLRNHRPQWSLLDLLAVPAVAGCTCAVSELAPLVAQHPVAFAAAMTLSYLALKALSVVKESIFASSNFGLQMETTRGLRLPFLPNENTLFTSTSTNHIPRDRILDLILNTAVRGWEIKDYLAVGIRSRPMGMGSSDDDTPKAEEIATLRRLQVLFPHLDPKLPIVERIYKTIYPVLFSSFANPVADAAAAAAPPTLQRHFDTSYHRQYPSTSPRADPNALIISGGSAGGFTVLACLTNHPSTFSAGCSLYGVTELTSLASESHKFESRYPLRLLGGSPKEVPEVYHDRSPLYRAGNIKSPVLIMQGVEDRVVPVNQARRMVVAILEQPGGEGRVKYIEFEGEGHGFRREENIIRALEEEEEWYRVKLGLGKQ